MKGPQPSHAWPLEDWHEDMGVVLWHLFPLQEPPWVGTPNDSDWPGYHTHFQPLPEAPTAVDPHKTADETFALMRTLNIIWDDDK